MNPQDITYLVNNTLKRMGIVEPKYERLIRGTFLMESQLECMYDASSNRYGLMMLSEEKLDKIYEEFLPFNKRLRAKIKRATHIDLDKLTLDDFRDLARTNLSMMVCITYVYYMTTNKDLYSADIVDVASFYVKNYVGDLDPDLEKEFVEYYKETF